MCSKIRTISYKSLKTELIHGFIVVFLYFMTNFCLFPHRTRLLRKKKKLHSWVLLWLVFCFLSWLVLPCSRHFLSPLVCKLTSIADKFHIQSIVIFLQERFLTSRQYTFDSIYCFQGYCENYKHFLAPYRNFWLS